MEQQMSPWPFVKEPYPAVFNTPSAMQESPPAHMQPTTDGQTEKLIEGKWKGQFTQLVSTWYVVSVRLQRYGTAILIELLLYCMSILRQMDSRAGAKSETIQHVSTTEMVVLNPNI